MLIALVTTSAYQYFEVTGSPLDLGFVLFSLTSIHGLGDVVASEVPPGLLVLIVAVLTYAVLGPWLVTRLVGWWRDWPESTGARTVNFSWLRSAGMGLAACLMLSFAMVPGTAPNGMGKSVSRDAFINVAATAFEVGSEEIPNEDIAAEDPPNASLEPTARTEKLNVVLIHLESVRAQSVTP